MSVGDHWQWQARGQEESLQDGDARELGSEVAPTTRRRARRPRPTLELMVPPRSDLPSKGMVAGRVGGGGAYSWARRAAGGDVVEGWERGASGAIAGSGATECAPGGGAEAAQVVSSGAEERARLLGELAELGAGVRAQRASRLEHLRAVAADLTSCSGVTWRGL